MENVNMDLKILLPYRIFTETKNVSSIILETIEGSYGLLPQRLDCVAALVAGILTYEVEGKLHYLAIDEGLLIKAGTQVLVSVRNAIGGTDLGKLRESVDKDFMNLNESEKNLRSVMVKMESGLIFNMKKFRQE